jgi:hypothetical protein
MRRVLFITVAAGLMVAVAPVFGDDTMSHATPTDQQMLKECIERQKTKDVNMSKAQMKRFCKDELKNQKATGALPEQPPLDTPHGDPDR